jgi:hypothetical protein
MGTCGSGEIDKDDADDEGGLNAFTKSDQKSREQGSSS